MFTGVCVWLAGIAIPGRNICYIYAVKKCFCVFCNRLTGYNKMKKKYIPILIHIAGWLAFMLLPSLIISLPYLFSNRLPDDITPPPSDVQLSPFIPLLAITLIIGPFYLNRYYLLPKLYYNGKRFLYFIISIAFMLLAVYLPQYIQRNFGPPNSVFSELMKKRPFDAMFTFFSMLQFMVVWFFSSIVYLAYRNRLIAANNEEMKVQRLDAEVLYLKAQINPHFLFNTLNNIYALSICNTELAPEAILKLSSIMRYVTQDAQAEKVLLEQELDYLSDYIALEEMRSNQKLDVVFNRPYGTTHTRIAPLLLINFIENAFKHGVSNHIDCFVHVTITLTGTLLQMEVSNKKMMTALHHTTNRGIANTLRRLQLQYPGKHIYKVDDRDGHYHVILQLDLS